MEWVIEHWALLLEIFGAVLGVASMIAGLTESTKDDELVKLWIKRLSFLTNKSDKGTFKWPFSKK